MPMELDSLLERAARVIQGADALLVGAGAGMGVDSGLPDFRGNEGFWNAYPPFRGRNFEDVSNPYWFHADPELAWGFFGHRLNLYRETTPHLGFEILRRWGESLPLKYFVFTSNVDGQFRRAGFCEDRVIECHGSLHYLQCSRVCHRAIWPAEDVRVEVDAATIRARSALPKCRRCGAVARPNLLMFEDFEWLPLRYAEQRRRYDEWLNRVHGRQVVAVELGAGLAIPRVRWECENQGQFLIRINPRESDTPQGGISLPLRALEALSRMDEHFGH
ncbi:MAG TPA: Sir2 family NAD-dependent protein deacetylase [Gemmataceae bacterium]|nr:Sir2 family NAD-dependent protein deacetylase [Gemmataceae bacterium]